MILSSTASRSVFRKEARGYFITPVAYVFIVVYVSLLGLFTYVQGNFFEIGEASLGYSFFKWHPWLNAFLVPAIGMRIWTDETKQDTLELLLTHPLALSNLLISKYLAALVPLLTALALTTSNVITIAYLGSPDYGPVFTGYLGSFLVGASFLAISCSCSALSRSPVVAFILSCTICMLFLMIGSRQMGNELVGIFPRSRWMVESISAVGVLQYFETFQRGQIDFTSIAYFLSVIVLALFTNHRILAARTGLAKRTLPPPLMLALMIGSIAIMSTAFRNITLRSDMTADKIYSLSEGSEQILKALDREVAIRFYVNESANILPPKLRSYSKQVAAFLSLLERKSAGRIRFERYDPAPDSDDAVSAAMDHIQGNPLPSGAEAYMGIAFSCLDKKVSIPFLDPSREASLEYDIIRNIRDVSRFSEKQKIGIYGTVPLFGVADMFPKWQLLDELSAYYELKRLNGNETEIDQDIDLLLVVHPLQLNIGFEKAVDRFLQNGGKMMVMLDPVALSFMFYRQDLQEKNASSSWPRLEQSTGIRFSTTNAVLDMTLRSEMDRGEGVEQLSFILELTDRQLNAAHPIPTQVGDLLLPVVGGFQGTPVGGVEKTVLLHSTQDSSLMDANALLDVSRYEAETINKNFKADPNTYDLAVLLEGRLPSLFTGDVFPGTKPSQIILWGDSDFVSDPFAGYTTMVQGRELFYPKNDNLTLVLNAIDFLCNTPELNAARSKTRTSKPLTKLMELERNAEKKYTARIRELDRLATALNSEMENSRLVQSGKHDGTLRDAATQQRLDDLAEQCNAVQNELRILRKNLRIEITSIQNRIAIMNTFIVPLAWSLVGLAVLLHRHYKAKPQPTTSTPTST